MTPPKQDPRRIERLTRELAGGARIPACTYRFQFNAGFTFADAAGLVDYLDRLGVSDCYASPLLRARADSPHGYDITDHGSLNPALGSREEFNALSDALQARGMGLLVDIVPNHVGINDQTNAWWMDVLENGPASHYADYFDIDWHPAKAELASKVLLPILEDQYGLVLESGKLTLGFEEGRFWLHYWDHRLPVAHGTWRHALEPMAERLAAALGDDHEHTIELMSIVTALEHLPGRTERDPNRIEQRTREKLVIQRRLMTLLDRCVPAREALNRTLEQFNPEPGEPTAFDALHALIDRQAYRLAFWRTATDEINYRRFFDINDLAAIRIEKREVFEATHALIRDLIAEGRITGLRVDHPDGLWDPSRYFLDLQALALEAGLVAHRVEPEAAGRAAREELTRALDEKLEQRADALDLPLYLVAEKILSHDEPLPEDWAVHGTVGYDFLNESGGLFVNPANEREFDRLYQSFTGQVRSYGHVVYRRKQLIMTSSLASEVNALGRMIERLTEKNRRYRDFTLNNLIFAIREIIAMLELYRTYIHAPEGPVSRRDVSYIERAVTHARRRNVRTGASVFNFLRETLLMENFDDFPAEDRPALAAFVMKMQQLTGPVMAKGVEDTTFYVYNRLAALNEVGGHPDHFGVTPEAFHRHQAARRRHWPHAMLCGSTHDTKRSEDVRARLTVLSEDPRLWRSTVQRWSRLNQRRKTEVDGQLAPSRNDEYLLYQTLVGTWPNEPMDEAGLDAYCARIVDYMRKAIKEGKDHTSWINPNEEYDAAMEQFIEQVLSARHRGPFLARLESFAGPVAWWGMINSLAGLLLRLTSPGVPDIYRGCELWDLSLVDPDNRRPVEFARRSAMLDEIIGRIEKANWNLAPFARELVDHWPDGRIKLYLIQRVLDLRRQMGWLFREGEYEPVEAEGPRAEHVCAFLRRGGDSAALVVVPRLLAGALGVLSPQWPGEAFWGDTALRLPAGCEGWEFHNRFTDERVVPALGEGHAWLRMANVLGQFPVALLVP